MAVRRTYIQDHLAPGARNLIAEAVLDRWPDGAPLSVLCVGTDQCTGDSLGPVVGTLLSTSRLPGEVQVWGRIEQPLGISALRSFDAAALVGRWSLVIDAAVGERAGAVTVADGPFRPGECLGHDVGEWGECAVMGSVVQWPEDGVGRLTDLLLADEGTDPAAKRMLRLWRGFSLAYALRSASLGLVATMAGAIATGVLDACRARAQATAEVATAREVAAGGGR